MENLHRHADYAPEKKEPEHQNRDSNLSPVKAEPSVSDGNPQTAMVSFDCTYPIVQNDESLGLIDTSIGNGGRR